MGFEEDCFRESVDEMMDTALASESPWLKGIDRLRLEKQGHVRLNFGGQVAGRGSREGDVEGKDKKPFLPFAAGNFWTKSGKAELYSEDLKAQGLDPVASFVVPDESRHSPEAQRYPLELLARKAHHFLNSSFCNVPSVQEMEEIGLLEMNAADAQARGIREGDRVRVFNQRGEMLLKARVDGAVGPGVVAARLSWAKLSETQRNVNVLTSEKLTDMGNSATFYSVLVEVELSNTSS
jgi:anaerobic selenocysteine-containing dehydrogenase